MTFPGRRAPLTRSAMPGRAIPMARSPLARTSPIPSMASLSRTGGSVRTVLVSKQPKVSQEEREARRVVQERSGGRCELCGAPGESWSHRRAAGQGGAWRAANGVRACGLGGGLTPDRCHDWCEAHPTYADLGGWRLVHRDPDPSTAPVWLPGRGWSLLTDGTEILDGPDEPPPLVLPPRMVASCATETATKWL